MHVVHPVYFSESMLSLVEEAKLYLDQLIQMKQCIHQGNFPDGIDLSLNLIQDSSNAAHLMPMDVCIHYRHKFRVASLVSRLFFTISCVVLPS
jgi:hypothetical protein